MAKEALKKLEDQLNCLVCLDTYTDPKQLQCHHVFCRKCLVPLVVRDQQGQLTLTCPTCRQVTPVPAKGVAGLQSAFHINNLLELYNSFKKVEVSSLAEESVASPGPSPGRVIHCPEHEDKELELYCETCGKLICSHCALKSGRHHSHDYEMLHKAFEKFQANIAPSLEPMEKQVRVIHEALAQLDTRCGEISDQQAAIEENIHKSFRKLHEVLEVQETELIGQLHQITQEKLKGLAVQKDQIETTLAQLSSCLDFVKESLKTGSEGEVLMMKTTIVKQVKELTTTFQPDILKPNMEADTIFLINEDISSKCHNYGKLVHLSSLDPAHCHAFGKGTMVAVVGQKATAILHAVDFQGQPCEEPIKSAECELVSETTGRSTISRRGKTQYEVNYWPTIKGRHQLHIKVEDQHISGSPFSVVAKSHDVTLGTPSQIINVEKPWGVAITHRGDIVVTGHHTHSVSVFNPSGEKINSFGTFGTDEGQFAYPHGVAVDNKGNIVVIDRYNHRIQKFTADGQFLKAVGTEGSGPLQFVAPESITFNVSNKKLYIVDSNDHIQVLNADFTYSGTFGREGTGERQFDNPMDITCDSSGNVYVADCDNHRIQVFTAKGKFLRTFGKQGDRRGELDEPIGIAVDRKGMIYVSENETHRISTFMSEGQFVNQMGEWGEGPGEFKYPRGLAVDQNGVVYVCDSGNNRLQIFK